MSSEQGGAMRIPRKIRSMDKSKMRFFKVSATYFAVQTWMSLFDYQSPIRLHMQAKYLFMLCLLSIWYGVSFYFLLNPQHLH